MDENNLLNRSRALLARGDHHAASELLEVLINHNPCSVEALRALAQSRMAQGRPHDAVELLQKALVLIKTSGAPASDTAFDEQDAHYLQEQHTTQEMLREEGTSGLSGSTKDVIAAEGGDWLLLPIKDDGVSGSVSGSISATLQKPVERQAHSQALKEQVSLCMPGASVFDEEAGYGPWPFSRKLQLQLAAQHTFTETAINKNETNRTLANDGTLHMPKQEAGGEAPSLGHELTTGSGFRAQASMAYSRQLLLPMEEEVCEAEDIFQENSWDADLFFAVSANNAAAESGISGISVLASDDKNIAFLAQDGLWEPAATHNDISDELWYEDANEHAIDEFFQLGSDEAELPDQLTRAERARQIAMQVAEDYEWDRAGIRLLTALFERYSWSAAQTAIRRVLEAGTTAQELQLAEELRQIWNQRCDFWAAAGGGVLVQRYPTLSWPSALAIVRSFHGYPQPEEMEAVLDSCLDQWSKSVILQRRYPAFFSYALYRCGAHGNMEGYDGWVTFSAEAEDDEIFDSPDLAQELVHQGIRLSAQWQPPSRRIQQSNSAKEPVLCPASVTDDNKAEDEGELC